MDLQTTKQINIDVSQHKYISLNAKQYDRNLRYILITCYNQGELLPINKNTHFASIRYSKPDNYGVFNSCEITKDGKILVELTEQMLAVAGRCYADVVIHENVELAINITHNADDGTVEIIDTGNSGIISTMTFIVDVDEAAFDNQEIESSYEYNALNDLLTESRRSYENVLTTSNSYMKTTEGYMNTTKGYMNTTDNYMDTTQGYMETTEGYMETTEGHMDAAKEHMDNTKNHMETTQGYMEVTEGYRDTTQGYMEATEGYMSTTESYKNATSEYMSTTEGYMTTTDGYMNNAKDYMDTAESHMNTAKDYMDNAKASKEAAKASEEIAISNANLCKDVANGLNSGFIPVGTITFNELATAEKATGFTYNISDDFITDETFAEGAGMTYTAGTNVYCRSDGLWDCFGGTASPTATVDEVKEYLGI